MSGLNKAILIGNLGGDAEMRATQSGRSVLRCRLATTESYRDSSGERQERTEWHTVIIWGKRADSLEKLLTKGRRIGVEGRIQHRQWEDREGNSRTSTEINASDILLLDSRDRMAVRANSDPDTDVQEASIPF